MKTIPALLLAILCQTLPCSGQKTDFASAAQMARTLYTTSDFIKCIAFCDSMEQVWTLQTSKDSMQLFDFLLNRGKSQMMIGALEASLANLQTAKDIARRDPLALSECYNALGNSHALVEGYAEACAHYTEAIRLAESADSDYASLGSYYHNLGQAFFWDSQFDLGKIHLLKGLDLQKKHFGLMHKKTADSYSALGNLSRYLEDYPQAIDYQEQAKSIVEHLYPDPNHPAKSNIYAHLGFLYRDLGDYKNCINYLQKTRAIVIPAIGEHNSNIYSLNAAIADAYTEMGAFDEASRYMDLSDSADMGPAVKSMFLMCIAKKLEHEQKLKEALVYRQQAFDLVLKTGNSIHLIRMLNNLATNGILRKDYDAAIHHLKQSLTLTDSVFGKGSDAIIAPMLNLISCYDGLGQFEQSDSLYSLIEPKLYARSQDSLRITKPFEYQVFVWNKALRFERTRQSDSVICYYRKSYDFFKQLRSNYYDEEAVQWLNAEYSDIFERMIYYQHQIDSQQHKTFFTLAEEGKSYLLLNTLRLVSIAKNDPQLDTLQALRKRIRYLEDKISNAQPGTAFTWEGKSADTRQHYAQTLEALRLKNPKLYRLRYSNDIVDPDTLRQSILEKDQTLVEYLVGREKIMLFLLRRDTFVFKIIDKDFPLDVWVKRLHRGLYGHHAGQSWVNILPDSVIVNYAEPAYQLYQKLIAPVEGLLTQKVVVVTDGALGYVPFDVLLRENPGNSSRFHNYKYLGDRHVFSYSYSATLLHEMMEKKHDTVPNQSVLSLSPFSGNNRQMLVEKADSTALSLQQDTLRPLIFSEKEARLISELLKGRSLIGTEANLEQLTREAGKCRILHFSTHGKANDRSGEYAWLALALPGDSLAFVKLYVSDIYNLSLNCDLVVLSACETGIGELRRGEGIISLARAFAYAGAKSIVTTLWSVDNQSTGQLMRLFYKNLNRGMSKDEALWQAKKDFRASNIGKTYAHPFFWAGFIPVGDMGPVKN